MNKFALMGIAGAAVASAMVAAPAEAALFTVGNTQYDVTFETGTFDSLESTLTSQVWWNNEALAEEFASVVQDSLGLLNNTGTANPLGPLFAYELATVGQTELVNGRRWGSVSEETDLLVAVPDASVLAYAVATVVEQPESVPEPMTLLGLGAVGLVGADSALKHKQAADA